MTRWRNGGWWRRQRRKRLRRNLRSSNISTASNISEQGWKRRGEKRTIWQAFPLLKIFGDVFFSNSIIPVMMRRLQSTSPSNTPKNKQQLSKLWQYKLIQFLCIFISFMLPKALWMELNPKKSHHRIQLFFWWNFLSYYKTLSWGGSVLELLDKGRASIHGFPKGVQDPTPLPTQTSRIPWFLIILLSLILDNPPDLGGNWPEKVEKNFTGLHRNWVPVCWN